MHLSLNDVKKRKLYDVARVIFEEVKEEKLHMDREEWKQKKIHYKN